MRFPYLQLMNVVDSLYLRCMGKLSEISVNMFLLFLSLTICFFTTDIDGFLTGRRVVKTLTVSNGGEYGDWGQVHYCADGAYATGFNMKIEPYQHGGDDTELNAVQLICQDLDGVHYGGTAESKTGQWGNWVGQTTCTSRNGTPFFLTSFSLQVEKWQSDNDDTEANSIKFKCRDFGGSQQSYELAGSPGQFGSYGSWSESCPIDTAICGISTRVEAPQGSGDDTALNDVRLYCCQEENTISVGK